MNDPFKTITACRGSIDSLYNAEDTLFVERQWLVKKFEEFEQDGEKRHLLIVGEPGIGKSAFLAYLAHHRNSPRHFIRASTTGGIAGADPRSFLVSLGAQLYEKYGAEIFPQSSSGTVSVKADAISGEAKIVGQLINKVYQLPFLAPTTANVSVIANNVSQGEVYGVEIAELVNVALALDELTLLHVTLLNPVREIQKLYPTETVVVLINALDEASWQVGKKIVDIIPHHTDEVPSNLRLVMTSRRGDHLKRFRTEDTLLLDEGEHLDKLLEDAERYIWKQLKGETLHPIFEAFSPGKQNNFVAKIKKNSNGNFLYLYYLFKQLIQDAENGDKDLSDNIIPEGLDEIYRVFLIEGIRKSARNDEIWQKKYCPILGIMAVAYEPLSKVQIANFAEVEIAYVDEVINKIKQFLTESLGEKDRKTPCYRFYHSSIDGYLLKNPHYTFVKEDYHRQIASYYKKPSLAWDEIKLGDIDQYGLVHLAKHLEVGKQEEDLYALLTASPDWMNCKRNVLESDRPYIHDLELAIAQLNDPLEADQLLTLVKLYAARQVVYQRSSSYSDIDLETLVRLGPKNKALDFARSRAGNTRKVEALLTIHDVLREKTQPPSGVLDKCRDVLDEAVQIVNQIDESWEQTGNLRRKLAIALAKAERFDEAEKFADGIDEKQELWAKADALRELAVILSQAEDPKKDLPKAHEIFEKAEQCSRKIEGDQALAVSLRQLSLSLAKAKEGERASRLFDETEQLPSVADGDREYLAMLRDLSVALAQTGESQKADEIFKKAEHLTRVEDNLGQLRELAVAFAQAGNTEKASAVLNEAENLTREIPAADEGQVMPLYELAVAFARTQDMTRAQAILGEAENSIGDAWGKAKILLEFAKALAKAGFVSEAAAFLDKTGMATRNLHNNWARIDVLENLAVALAQIGLIPKARDVFKEAEKLSATAENEAQREQVLNKWAVALGHTGFYEAVNGIRNDPEKLEQAKEEMELVKTTGEQNRERAELLIEVESLEDRRDFFTAIKQADSSTEVLEIVKNAVESNLFGVKTLDGVGRYIALHGENCFSLARKVTQAIIADNPEQEDVLNELSKVVASLGYFKEAFTIRGLKHGLSHFLDELVDWLFVSEKAEQKLLVETLQETTQIFGWLYQYWYGIYEQLLLGKKRGDFSKETIQTLKRIARGDAGIVQIQQNSNFTTITYEQAQDLETYVQEAVSILYHNALAEELITFEDIEEAVLAQISQIVRAKVTSLQQDSEHISNINP